MTRHSLRWLLLFVGSATLAAGVVSCSHDSTAPIAPADDSPPIFEEVSPQAGVDFTYRNGEEAGHFAIIESLGGGVALFDFDNDGRLDILFPGGGHFDGKNVLGNPGRLYRNLGNWKFEDVTAHTGLDAAYQYSHGAAAFDYDCDGWLDLLITGYSRLVLFHNESDGQGGRRFVDVTGKAGLNDSLWSTTAAWGDLDGDGFPDLYIARYGDWGFESNHPTDCTYDGKTRDVCQPRRFKPLPHAIYRNNRDGTFTDVSSTLKLRTDGKGMSAIMVDLDGDGRPDIYAANDTDDNFLYMNRGGGKKLALEEIGLAAGAAQDDRGTANGSMGIDVADYDRSGRPSIIVSNYEGELPALYANRSSTAARFHYSTQASGIAAIGGIYVGWGIGFIDCDWDGWQDLVMVNGHAIRFPTKIERKQKPVLMRNEKGRFQDISAQGGPYFRSPHNARGLAFGDLDNDGRIDCVVSHLNEPVSVLRNVAVTAGRHWVGVELVGKNNRDVVGARVVLESAGGKQVRYAKGGGSFASTNDRRQVIGLGSDSAVKATVYWPSGEMQEFANLPVDGYWKLVEGSAKPLK
ncbi:MAG TPA: CRTAC1 family protein [Urbifossiella sp.]|nr:CRTAC1 family protein [Urbifossiella sp.]